MTEIDLKIKVQTEIESEIRSYKGIMHRQNVKDNEESRHSTQNWSLSEWIDSKPHQGSEEEHDANMRREGVMLPRERGGGQQGRGSCGQNKR